MRSSDAEGVASPPPPRDAGQPYRICVVCRGNICRSPMAERVLAAALDGAGLADRVVVDSAGTGDWHVGQPMDHRARAELTRRGHNANGHNARQIQPGWLDDYDLLLAIDRFNLALLTVMARGKPELANRIMLMRAFDPAAPADAEVPDPYDGRPEDFAEVFDLVEVAAKSLVSQLQHVL